MLAFSKGVNRVELNKTIKKATPEEIITKRVFLDYFFYENKNSINFSIILYLDTK